tara:strand:+ start:138 stop:278 length:141 start_codon:yes stop_codon:yes gene_type:complete
MVVMDFEDAELVGENIGRLYLKNPTLFKILVTIYLLIFLYLLIRFS